MEVFRRFFEAMVEQCQQAGLVWGKELYIDGTKVEANASLDSLKPRFYIEAHLSHLFETESSLAGERTEQVVAQEEAHASASSEQEERPVPMSLPNSLSSEQDEDLAQRNAARHDWIEQLGAQDRRVTHRSYQRIADLRVSTTDPDATLMETSNGSDMGYRTHYVVDGGRARIIMAALVTPFEVTDNQPMLDLLWRVRFRWKLWPRHVTGDTKYGTEDNIVAIEEQHIHAYVPLPDNDHRTAFLSADRFRYESERDVYICPAGKELHFFQAHSTDRQRRYRARAKDCNHCPRHPPNARPASRGGVFAAVCMRSIWIGSEATTQRKPTRRRTASGVSGLSRYSRDLQTVAWYATLSLAAPLARELRGFDASGWAKSQTVAQKARMGTASVPSRGPVCLFLGAFA